MIDLSVLIINWNSRELLRKCLESVLKQTRNISSEILVIDNASSDGSSEMVAKGFHTVRLIRNQQNMGFPAATNQGIESSSGRYVLVLNPDVELLDEAIAKMIAFIDQHKSVGVLGCKLLNPDGSLQISCHRDTNPQDAFALASGLYGLFRYNGWTGWLAGRLGGWFSRFVDFADHESVLFPDWVLSCCMVMRRQALDDVGLMDEDFFLYWDEPDLCYRMRQHGWQVGYTPQAQAIHVGGRCISRIMQNISVLFWLNMLRLYQKHFGPCLVIRLRIAVLLGITVRSLCSLPGLIISEQRPAWPGSANMEIIRWMLHGRLRT